MKIISIIQARCGSTRLPNKVLMPLQDKPVLEHVINRSNQSKTIEETFVATTINKPDLQIVNLCSDLNTRVFCGAEDDVLDRFFQLAKIIKPEHIVRITSDCPVIDPVVIDKVVNEHLCHGCDYTSNTLEKPYPDGEDVEVFTFEALKKAWTEARLASEREHVTPYIKNHSETFRLHKVLGEPWMHSQRWCLDELKDFEFLKIIFQKLYPKDKSFGIDLIYTLIKAHPEITDINSTIIRDEGYLKSIQNDKKVRKLEE